MLSILIPTYNYNVFPLVLELHKQCLECEIDFEILCQDDDSNTFFTENQKINSLENCNFSRNNSNLGRGKTINLLAEKAKFETLLIMDCDTIPTQNDFIHNYISEIKKVKKIVFGGIAYKTETPAKEQMLRWVYGQKREAIPVEKRIENPNKTALTSNLLIEKQLFISNKFDESITKYGYEDLVFLTELKKKGILVKHIENPTYHLGLETSEQFLEKTKIALENLVQLYKTNLISVEESKVLITFRLLQKLNLTIFISFLFKKFESNIVTNLLSEKPSLFLFDIFKLGYFCSNYKNL